MSSVGRTQSMAAIVEADRPAVLFDMDGVVITGRSSDPIVHERAMEDLLVDYGLRVPETLRPALSAYEYSESFVDACEAIEVDPVPFYTARELHSARRIAERVEAGVRQLTPGVSSLARLAEGYELALVSNNYNRVVETVVEHFQLEHFTVVRGREPGVVGFRRRKPEPFYLEETLERLGADAGLYVGDRETDLQAAARADLDSVYVSRPYNDPEALETEPTAVIDSLTELQALLESPAGS